MSVLKQWRAGLMDEIGREIKHQLRYNRSLPKGWKVAPKKKPYVVLPSRPMYINDRRETGRSEKYHAEQVEEKTLRYELGADLWADDLTKPDMESFEGTELTDAEYDMMEKVLSARDAHLNKGK